MKAEGPIYGQTPWVALRHITDRRDRLERR
jgi:hypothetical protein